jgi:hypothetical protein
MFLDQSIESEFLARLGSKRTHFISPAPVPVWIPNWMAATKFKTGGGGMLE